MQKMHDRPKASGVKEHDQGRISNAMNPCHNQPSHERQAQQVHRFWILICFFLLAQWLVCWHERMLRLAKGWMLYLKGGWGDARSAALSDAAHPAASIHRDMQHAVCTELLMLCQVCHRHATYLKVAWFGIQLQAAKQTNGLLSLTGT